MSANLHVVALGARTPLGLSAEATAAAVRARINRIVHHPFLADRTNANVLCAIEAALDAGLLGRPRITALAGSALSEAGRKLTPRLPRDLPLTVLIALPEARPGFDADDLEQVLQALRARTRDWQLRVQIEVYGRGHAGGLHALAEAARRILGGEAGLFLVGGADSYLEYHTIDWLQEDRQLHNHDSRSGFAPGEAAGFVALASDNTRRALGLESLAQLRGSCVTLERKLLKSDDINLGEGLAAAVHGALIDAALELPAEAPDAVYCDINGERYRTEEWGLALLRMPLCVRDTTSLAPAEFWGDVGAATGPLLCVLAARAWARRYARGPRALLFAGSESGTRAAVVLQAPSV
jgi:3-oxoacyl-[acyl-carrier-protein] synthase-1